MKIGILSDTHGVLKDTFLDELQSCDYLLHAGDIGSLKCYETLKDLHVPLYIIKGNCDKGEWTKYLPKTLAAPIGGKIFYLIHKKSDLPYPQPEADFIITGHTHHYEVSKRGTTTFINPGSAGRNRSGSSCTIAILTLDGDDVSISPIYTE
jgi:putative phosphoesterase